MRLFDIDAFLYYLRMRRKKKDHNETKTDFYSLLMINTIRKILRLKADRSVTLATINHFITC